MTRVILWAILVIVLLRAVSRLMRGILEGMGHQPRAGGRRAGVPLARDPVCGVFVVPGQALTAQRGGTTQYFCSEQCRQAWDGR
ncbi:MAG: hypothetical protein A3H96_18340 [Acidobacteria bacterium RIFCSPLOWO2_02_FULL_67_36]|nr:MAG: hypothetical protein A3H96_18340 [Acidobacteria bacterium RIFCSPLOWO2_02_FULL_67_36]OFW19046.1 MAG: hypothetical protein A3G21_04950 [Acidobacteria bacterium RIFCSPLOWO2_12_FULL_66_21]